MRRTLALAIALLAVISASLPLMSSSGAGEGTTSSPWPCLQADQRHTGHSQANLSDNPGQIALEMSLHNDGYSSGLVLGPDGTIYIGDWHSGMLFAIGRDGKERWRFQAINGIGSPPTIGEDGSIYFGTFYYHWGTGSTANNLYALNPNGTVRWFYPVQGDSAQTGVSGSPVVDGYGTVYAGTMDGYVLAVRADGTLAWRTRMSDPVRTSLAMDQEGRVIAVTSSGNVSALWRDGSVAWTVMLNAPSYFTPVVGPGGMVLVCADDGWLYALQSDGSLAWRHRFAAGGSGYSAYTSLVLSHDEEEMHIVYCMSSFSSLQSLDMDGILVRNITMAGRPHLLASSQDDVLLYSYARMDFTGHLVAMDRNGSVLWDLVTDQGQPYQVAIDQYGTVLALYSDRLVAIDEAPGPSFGEDEAVVLGAMVLAAVLMAAAVILLTRRGGGRNG